MVSSFIRHVDARREFEWPSRLDHGALAAWKQQPEMDGEWPAWWAWETRRALANGGPKWVTA